MSLKIIHTADWHLGQTFFGYDRDEEHEAFLSWLIDILTLRQTDVLLIAGLVPPFGTLHGVHARHAGARAVPGVGHALRPQAHGADVAPYPVFSVFSVFCGKRTGITHNCRS